MLTLHRGGTCFVVAVARHAALTGAGHASPALSERLSLNKPPINFSAPFGTHPVSDMPWRGSGGMVD